MIVEGPIDELAKRVAPSETASVLELQISPDAPETVAALRQVPGVIGIERNGEVILVQAGHDVTTEVSRVIADRGASVVSLRRRGFTLDDIYFRYFRESQGEARRARSRRRPSDRAAGRQR